MNISSAVHNGSGEVSFWFVFSAVSSFCVCVFLQRLGFSLCSRLV